MRLSVALSVAAALAAGPTLAQSLRDCDGFEASARNLIFPVEDSTRTFANGAIRLIGLDTGGEPVCCSSHLMVLVALPDEPGDLCLLVSHHGTQGWSGISVGAAQASYDPAEGLTVRVPVGVYNGAGSDPGTVTLLINQATGTVTAR